MTYHTALDDRRSMLHGTVRLQPNFPHRVLDRAEAVGAVRCRPARPLGGVAVSADQQVDLLVATAHPDDEVSTFGAIIPLAHALGRRVASLCMTRSLDSGTAALREDELRASLQTCGLPGDALVLGGFPDCGYLGPGQFESLAWVWERWGGRDAVRDFMVGLYRRLRPLVVFAHHPETGEYGHPNHMAAGMACIDAWDAMDAAGDPATPCKIYVLSDADDAWCPDWHAPQPTLGGRSPAAVGALALRCHRSQSCHAAGIRPYLRFATIRSRVGDDTEYRDIFEHCRRETP